MGVKRSSWFNLMIVILMAIAAGTVLVASVLTTIYYDMHVGEDFPHYKSENYLLLGISVAIFFVLFMILRKRDVFQQSNKCLMAGILFCIIYCLTLILAIKPQPVNDSKLIDDVLKEFMDGNYSSLLAGGGYLYTWPFQLGYVLFGQTMIRFFGEGNYLAWDLVQLLSIILTIFFLYMITWELFESRVICGIMAIMSMGMLFFYNYVTYIYGDILSMAPQTIAIYCIALYIKKKNAFYALLSAPFIAAAVVIKTNCEIALIAMIMGIFIGAFSSDKNKRIAERILVSAVIIAVVFGSKYAIDQYYCKLTGLDEIPGGSPAVSHIVMGVSESELENGWYNGYNYRVFAENEYNTEMTKKAATKDLMERLDLFAHHPRYTFMFFGRKFLTQWADPVCISTHNLDLVSRHVENQPALCDFLVFGTGREILSWIMNVFMTVCYLGVVIYLIHAIRRGGASRTSLFLLILIFGGIVFHEFWEGSSRYAMRYYVYWIPFAAWGIEAILAKVSRN